MDEHPYSAISKRYDGKFPTDAAPELFGKLLSSRLSKTCRRSFIRLSWAEINLSSLWPFPLGSVSVKETYTYPCCWP